MESIRAGVVIETSPNNFKARINHGPAPLAAARAPWAKPLPERFTEETSSADWMRLGRLPGFTNSKPLALIFPREIVIKVRREQAGCMTRGDSVAKFMIEIYWTNSVFPLEAGLAALA